MMKKVVLFLTVLVALGSMSFLKTDSSDGIQFSSMTFDEALAEAKKTNKLIFLDAYAEWCGPCKYMANNTFKDKDVAALFNKHFINLKIDMEKGEGPSLAQRYQVRAYPTLFFINSRGEVVKKVMGAKQSKDLIQIGQSVLN
jgi:thioredoxin 1